MGSCILLTQWTLNLLRAVSGPAGGGGGGGVGRNLLRLGMFAALLAMGAKTVVRNEDWASEEALYRSGLEVGERAAVREERGDAGRGVASKHRKRRRLAACG